MAAQHYNNYSQKHGSNTQEKGNNKDAAAASVLGSPFYNPYTFIPFPDKVERALPTPLSIDEHPEQQERMSGVLELEVTTLSPLLSCDPVPCNENNGHKSYKALRIGNDVVVPATGIRGALRTLMTIISGGTLGYMDADLYLTQGRDAQLGPSKLPNVPKLAFLARVEKPGSSTQPGTIRLGSTRLILVETLESAGIRPDDYRPDASGRSSKLFVDNEKEPRRTSAQATEQCCWQVKFSGRPINRKFKREGLFKAGEEVIELDTSFWAAYQGRNRHSVRPALQEGDLIWLEPHDLNCTHISSAADIKSIQWARWGRSGVALKDMVPKCVLPDSMRTDGKVDMVTDLFGQVPLVDKAAQAFAARIRPGNLVFTDAGNNVVSETLAPLSAPHPGCIAFYRDHDNYDDIDKKSPLKGYKVYRNTTERGEKAPWKYSVQGVYGGDNGDLEMPATRKVNKTAELLNEGSTGMLRIAFRALNPKELSLLLAAMTVDWKLGGGKPLGLGHCRITDVTLIDESGTRSKPLQAANGDENLQLTKADAERVARFDARIALYRASQLPVDKLRYPRAVDINKYKKSRAGLAWFARHASPRKAGKGLETIWTTGELKAQCKKTQIRAQGLPKLVVDDKGADRLYGYDLANTDCDTSNRNQKLVGKFTHSNPGVMSGSHGYQGNNTSQNSGTRRNQRDARSGGISDETWALLNGTSGQADKSTQRTAANPAQDKNTQHTPKPDEPLSKENIGMIITKEFDANKVNKDRAVFFLDKLAEYGISKDNSNKWRDKIVKLEKVAGR